MNQRSLWQRFVGCPAVRSGPFLMIAKINPMVFLSCHRKNLFQNKGLFAPLYPEGVAHHSPGSRSAPWDPVDGVESTLKGLYKPPAKPGTTLSG